MAGVRYFTCEPLKGVFSKAAKLTRKPDGNAEDASNLDKTVVVPQSGAPDLASPSLESRPTDLASPSLDGGTPESSEPRLPEQSNQEPSGNITETTRDLESTVPDTKKDIESAASTPTSPVPQLSPAITQQLSASSVKSEKVRMLFYFIASTSFKLFEFSPICSIISSVIDLNSHG